jgi:hypothetical protein
MWLEKNKLIEELTQKVQSAKKYRLPDVRIHAMGDNNIKKLGYAVEKYLIKNEKDSVQEDRSAPYTRNVRIIINYEGAEEV